MKNHTLLINYFGVVTMTVVFAALIVGTLNEVWAARRGRAQLYIRLLNGRPLLLQRSPPYKEARGVVVGSGELLVQVSQKLCRALPEELVPTVNLTLAFADKAIFVVHNVSFLRSSLPSFRCFSPSALISSPFLFAPHIRRPIIFWLNGCL